MISTRMSTRGRGPVESLGVGGGPFQPNPSLTRPVAIPTVATVGFIVLLIGLEE